MIRRLFTRRITWQNIIVEVSYEPDWWLDENRCAMARLQVCAITPERTALPISETGYRSHFVPADSVTALGGPIEYVRAWLDHEAASPAWQAARDTACQLSLF